MSLVGTWYRTAVSPLFPLCVLLALGCASSPPPLAIRASMIENDWKKSVIPTEGKLSIPCIIDLPPDYLAKFPRLKGDDGSVWPLFFRRIVEACFLSSPTGAPESQATSAQRRHLIVRPELWGFFLQSHGGEWTCWLDIKLVFREPSTGRTFSTRAEGFARSSYVLRALTAAMDQVTSNAVQKVPSLVPRDLSTDHSQKES